MSYLDEAIKINFLKSWPLSTHPSSARPEEMGRASLPPRGTGLMCGAAGVPLGLQREPAASVGGTPFSPGRMGGRQTTVIHTWVFGGCCL